MLLALDIGNTRLKWGLHDGRDWLQRSHNIHDLAAVAATLTAQPDRLIVSNVSSTFPDEVWLQRFGHLPHKTVHATHSQCGVHNSYQPAQQLGSDRWAALIGARNLGAGTALIINAGTALTVDALHQGKFMGGTITPGYRLMRDALAQHTRLPHAYTAGPVVQFPHTTAEAIDNGCLNALLGSIARMHTHLAQQTSIQPTLWLSGGDAPRLAPHLNARLEEHLVLHGLYCIAQELFN
ncbi:MAG: type III pantothenate kinase [Betaproteobacteria bacterium]|nr:type III pantothenate kinase [Betaproteobacteria bacterium]